MNRKRMSILGVLALLVMPWASAQAGVRIGVGIGAPCYYRPCYPRYRVYVGGPPVYYAPAPVIIAGAPAPVYVTPVPAPVVLVPPQAPAVVQAPAAPVTTAAYSAPVPTTALPPAPIPVAGPQ